MAYLELKYAIDQDFASNGLSMYSGANPPFQIDANFGLAGAVLSMLVVDLPLLSSDTAVQTIILGPAIPAAWAGGQVKGLRLRGGGYVNFSWDSQGLVVDAHLVGRAKAILLVNKDGKVLAKH
jgi:alpha-L-fucosidase 2